MLERVSFPLVLNMNDYKKGYEGIENKLYDQEVERMAKYKGKEMEKNVQEEMQKTKALEKRRNKKENEEK